ncbi:HNH endonuclease [Antarcticirhabdus aurantiaca]|uniref:HNH endonuclease n=1 Tax=Antarcticirhabdus aurantiaca TaxID=2606717 RepID=UPI00131BBBA6|nr:HNH endonuclease signature motif containing protein [Antarcticirhabdus aurantiaca]
MAKLATLRPSIPMLDTRIARVPPKETDLDRGPEHKAWRLAVLNKAGWKCEDCGKQGGRGGVKLYADHIVERKDGGALYDPRNGRCRCASCHTKKTVRERARRLGLA